MSPLLYPPIHSEFNTLMRFPMIGKQRISLGIESHQKALLKLEGIVNFQGCVLYKMNSTGHFEFELTQPLLDVLSTYKCSITNARYYDGIATICISIDPIRFSRNIKLLPVSSPKVFSPKRSVFHIFNTFPQNILNLAKRNR